MQRAATVVTLDTGGTMPCQDNLRPLSAFVAVAAPGAGLPSGTVTFLDAGVPVGSAPLLDGRATLTAYTLTGGDRAVTARYSGDGSFVESESAPQPLKVLVPVTFQADPLDARLCEGAAASLEVVFSGSVTSMQWRHNGQAIPGQTGRTLTLSSVTASDAGAYDVLVVGSCGTVASRAATVSVEPRPKAPALSLPSSARPSQAGLLARVPAHEGSVYQWTVANGAITAGQGAASITFTAGPAGVVSISVTETGAGGCSSPASTGRLTVGDGSQGPRLVPIVLDVHGRNGSHFTTELFMANTGSTDQEALLEYTPASAFGPQSAVEGVYTVRQPLAAGRQLLVTDTLGFLQAAGVPVRTDSGAMGGTLRVYTASSDAVSVGARTTSPTGPGRAGTAYSGELTTSMCTDRAWVPGLRENGTDRSNLALVNAGQDGPVTLEVTLHSGDPEAPGSFPLAPLTLEAGQWTQLDSVLSRAGLTNGWAEITRVDGSERFDAYAVFNDRVTNDGSFVPEVQASAPAGPMTIPVLVRSAAFLSELVLTNPGAEESQAELSYVESLAAPGHAAGTVRFTLRPHQQLIVPDAVAWLRSLGADIPQAPANAGALTVLFLRHGLPAAGMAGARTSAPAPDGGAYGVFTPAVPVSRSPLESARVAGLRQDDAVRSNLALVHLGDDPAPIALVLDVFDGDTGQLVDSSTPVLLGPGQWFQANQLLAPLGIRNGWVRVRKTEGSARFLAYGVVNDGTPDRPGTNDGSFIPMDPER